MQTTNGQVPAKVAEHLRDDEIHVWQLARRHAQGRAPLHALLAAYLGIDPEQVRLVEDAHGRPALDPCHASCLGFNWSHSGERALVALARHLAPGVDLELRRLRPRALAIAQRYFDAAEAAWLASLDGDARSTSFLELWTAKEAVLKALGRGLAFGLQRIALRSDAAGLALVRLDGHDIRDWQLQRLDLGADNIAALAWRGSTRQIRLFTLADTA